MPEDAGEGGVALGGDRPERVGVLLGLCKRKKKRGGRGMEGELSACGETNPPRGRVLVCERVCCVRLCLGTRAGRCVFRSGLGAPRGGVAKKEGGEGARGARSARARPSCLPSLCSPPSACAASPRPSAPSDSGPGMCPGSPSPRLRTSLCSERVKTESTHEVERAPLPPPSPPMVDLGAPPLSPLAAGPSSGSGAVAMGVCECVWACNAAGKSAGRRGSAAGGGVRARGPFLFSFFFLSRQWGVRPRPALVRSVRAPAHAFGGGKERPRAPLSVSAARTHSPSPHLPHPHPPVDHHGGRGRGDVHPAAVARR